MISNGDGGARTLGLLNAIQTLSQLSYAPKDHIYHKESRRFRQAFFEVLSKTAVFCFSSRKAGRSRTAYDSFTFRLLSMRTRPSWICSLKKSFAEQPARPEDAQAQAHAQEDAQAQEETQAQLDAQDEWCEEPLERCEFPEEPEERGRLTGTLITLT